jgi:hypothetical protein
MQLDKMDGVGLQMTHSLDTYVSPLLSHFLPAHRLS